MKPRWRDPQDIDFSEVPDIQLRACAHWEYARESRVLCDWRIQLPEPSEMNASNLGVFREFHSMVNGEGALMLAEIVFTLRLLDLYKLGCRDWQGGYHLKTCAWTEIPDHIKAQVDMREALREERGGHSSSTRSASTGWNLDPVTFNINWSRGIPDIVDAFTAWARANCPPGTSLRRSRGRNSKEDTRYLEALKLLRALRIRSMHPWEKAKEIDARWKSDTAWMNACRSARETYFHLLGDKCGEPRSWTAIDLGK